MENKPTTKHFDTEFFQLKTTNHPAPSCYAENNLQKIFSSENKSIFDSTRLDPS